MILPTLDYCGAVLHGCGKGSEENLERLQRRGGRIVLNTSHLSAEEMVNCLGWDTLSNGREKRIKLVHKCLIGRSLSYFSKLKSAEHP